VEAYNSRYFYDEDLKKQVRRKPKRCNTPSIHEMGSSWHPPFSLQQ
jgi:hypothetical protein